MNDGDSDSSRNSSAGASAASLAAVFDLDPVVCRARLDERYAVLDEVLALHAPVVIYPAARMGRAAASRLAGRHVRIVAFGDGSPALWGTRIDGISVLSPEEIGRQHRCTPVLLASTMFDSVIREDLERRGCEAVVPVGYLNLRLPDVFVSREYAGAFTAVTDPANRPAIEEVYTLLADEKSRRVFVSKLAHYVDLEKSRLDAIRSAAPVYFDRSVYELGSDETMVDGGAYVGDTLAAFRRATRDRFRAYFAFEPDQANFAKVATLAAADRARIEPIAAGLARRTGQLRFSSTSSVDARILAEDEPGGEALPVVGLDEFFADRQPPTLIKMDIEGSEEDALLGASGLANRAAPKMAISVYHHPSDLWSVPLLLKRLNPDYRLYLRHYTREVDDTVCYALVTKGSGGRSA
jgi:FkbM family methyltransferase